MTFYLAQASWEYARGDDIATAHRLGELALETAEPLDPSGIAAAATALVAETAALRGEHARAASLAARCPDIPLCSSAVIADGLHQHLAAAQLVLGTPRAGDSLRDVASRFAAEEQYGFVAETLHAGVGFGRRCAARELCAIAGELDGNLHRMRVDHASALLEQDPVALMGVADRFRESGMTLYAVEVAATASRLPDAPKSLVGRTRNQMAVFAAEHTVSGHAVLRSISGTAGGKELTQREREFSRLIDAGLSNAEIAQHLTLSQVTVEGQITRIYRKVGDRRRSPARR